MKKIGDYLLKDEIGKGSFATVYRATHFKTNEEFAAKQISNNLLSEGNALFYVRNVIYDLR